VAFETQDISYHGLLLLFYNSFDMNMNVTIYSFMPRLLLVSIYASGLTTTTQCASTSTRSSCRDLLRLHSVPIFVGGWGGCCGCCSGWCILYVLVRILTPLWVVFCVYILGEERAERREDMTGGFYMPV